MAKYEVKFSCGHTQIIELFGKDKDRQRKIEYFEERGLCKDCYKAMMQEIEAYTPLGLTAQLNPLETYPFRAYFTGDTESVEDKVEALGFFWTDIGDSDILSTSECMGWSCEFKSSEELGVVIKEVKKVFPKIEVKFDFKEVDMVLFKRLKEQEAQNEIEGRNQAAELQKKIDELEKPQRPDCYPKGIWNGRFYKAEKGYRRIYVDGNELLISEEDGQAIDDYLTALSRYEDTVAKLKEGV